MDLLQQTVSDWLKDKAPRLGAALAYYAIFSIPPLVVLVIGGAGLVYQGDVSVTLERELAALIGSNTATTVMELSRQQRASGGYLAGTLDILLLLFGASGVFAELQDAMNTIWEVQPKPGRGIKDIVKDRFLSFTVVLGIGFLLMVSMVLTSVIAILGELVANQIPGFEFIGHVLELSVSFAVVTILFALMFKLLPDVKIQWRDVWVGALLTSGLFTIGKFAIGMYLAKAAVASPYGAAGSVIIMIVWVYYSSQILFFGAEFTKVYTNSRRRVIKPADNAKFVTEAQRASQGLKPKSAA